METHASFPETLGGFAVLLLVLAALRVFARSSRLPAESWILIAGLLYGLTLKSVPSLPILELSPDLVILLLLPALIFSSARELSPQHLKAEGRPILLFATVGVLCTLFLIGLPLYAVTALPLADALLFAAAVAATDPSAVSAIFQRFHVPHKLAALIEGESLFNDGTAILLFFTVASLVIGMETFSLTDTALTFGWMVVVAVLLGSALGWCAGRLIRYWSVQNQFSGISITLALVYGGFLVAEELLHVSGVITVMFAAWMFVFQRRPAASDETKPVTPIAGHPEFFVGFWDYISQLAGGILFFALGVTVGRHEFPFTWLIPGSIAMLLLARMLVIYGGSLLLKLSKDTVPMAWQHVLVLGGLRGAVSVALLLMLPEDYIYREYMLCLALVLCLYTLVIHPLILQAFLKRQNLEEQG
ncbi:cation:proton antiporter [Marinobacter sp.]|uniref:cation:proton antiporter n=1 Tax=Marinobacter sp. TaxID=50741 RepID=UPI0023541805|nr:cation:proton antiporter [Marinobacter sp.]